MASKGLLAVLWIGFIVGLATAREVVNCLDAATCSSIKAVVQGPDDVVNVMSNYPRAKIVDLHGNLLTQFPSGYSVPAVPWERLNLSYNLLQDDLFASFRPSQLKYVDITYNQLERVTVPSSVVEFIAERNKLHTITIQSRAIQRLILPKNKFDSFRGFGNLAQLVELDLSCNQMSTLNVNDLSSMSNLRKLNMANNHVHIIEGASSIRSLEQLDLSNNILTTVDASFNNFPNIKKLFLQSNKIVMWTSEAVVPRSLESINIEDNDWDCGSLNALKNQISYKIVRGSDSTKCTDAESPYADRLIKYRKQEFRALQEGTAQREGNISCSTFKPNPCDGDDNRVHEVAGSAVRNAEDLAKADVQQLEASLAREQNAVNQIKNQIDAARREKDQLTNENDELAGYINEQYQAAGLAGDSDPIVQLNKIFEHYEKENADLKREIDSEERNNQDKLNEINLLQTEIDDENYRKEKLLEELNKRNTTVTGYTNRITELQKQLDARG